MLVSVSNSSDIGVFNSVVPGGSISVTDSQSVRVFSAASGSVSLANVTGVNNRVELGNFGSVAVDETVLVSVDNSSDIGIFQTITAGGLVLSAKIFNSSRVNVFGSVLEADTITVDSSSDIGVFGLTRGELTLSSVKRATITGSGFGSVPVRRIRYW